MLVYLMMPALQAALPAFQADTLKAWSPHLLRVAHPDTRPGSLPGLRRCALCHASSSSHSRKTPCLLAVMICIEKVCDTYAPAG